MREWTRRRPVRLALAVVVIAVVAVVGAPAFGWAAAPDRVKYYEVAAAYRGQPEDLSEIARRFLGTGSRANEIFDLNQGRVQPDGGKLTDPRSLNPGWLLVLPWDAVGDEVHYGVLPAAPSTTPSGPAAPTGGTGTPPPAPTSSAAPPVAPSGCPALSTAGPAPDRWAQDELAPRDAWSAGRGDGVVVAVVDSGVDASVPELNGRVTVGANVVSGSDGGDADCLGTGTAMAALIAADNQANVVGVAPAATILPIRVATDQPAAAPADQATAIDVSVSAGARVIALGALVDITAAPVKLAVENASRHDVVVVAGPAALDGPSPAQLIRVGAVDRNGQAAQAYQRGSIDVLAPGVDVASLGLKGQGPVRASGTQYAVALVAGAVALIRGADPSLGADAVVRQIKVTATPLANPAPAAGSADDGWRMVSLAGAMAIVKASPTGAGEAPAGGSSLFPLFATLVLVTLLAVGGLVLFRRRRPAQAPPAASDGDDGDGPLRIGAHDDAGSSPSDQLDHRPAPW